MHPDETELEMTRRHVAEGRALVKRQRVILAELRVNRHPTAAAERFLAILEATQRLHEEHMARLTGGDGGQAAASA